MLKALGNVAPRHLLDTRLNPPAALRGTVRPLASLGAALRPVEGRLRPDTTDAVEAPDVEPAAVQTTSGGSSLLQVIR
jgi:hypothetical protein